jgi:hypothetical protein
MACKESRREVEAGMATESDMIMKALRRSNFQTNRNSDVNLVDVMLTIYGQRKEASGGFPFGTPAPSS